MSDRKLVMYEVIKKLEDLGVYKKSVNVALISTTLNAKKDVYEVFLKNTKKTKRTQAVTDTAEDVKRSESYVWNCIKIMEN